MLLLGAKRAILAGKRDRDLAAWVMAVAANGGSVSPARRAIVGQFIAAEKTAGTWALTDDYWGLWAENEAQAPTSLKQRRLGTAVGSPTFTVDRGYAFNGSSQYIDTGFIPSTHGINCTGTDQRIGVDEWTNVSSSGNSAGVVDAAARCLAINNRNSGDAVGRVNNTGTSFALALADSRWLKAVSRAGGGAAVKMFDRGAKLTDGTATTPGSSPPTRALYIGASNNGGTAANFRAASIGFVVVGGPLSDAQELAQYNAVQSWRPM